jgi:hypothetical protein
MKNLIFLFTIACFLFSCSKSDQNENPSNKEKAIEPAFFLASKPVVSKYDTLFLGLRYNKNYTEQDEVYLNVNGSKINPFSRFSNAMEGNNVLFAIPPTNQVIDLNIKLTIKNNQNEFNNERNIKVVENKNLEFIWDKLTLKHLESSFPFLSVGTDNIFFTPNLFSQTSSSVVLGAFLDDFRSRNTFRKSNILINGIYGRYELKYDVNTLLKEIYILNGEPQIIQGLTYESVVNEVNSFYGPSKSSGFDQTFKRITTFETQRFKIVVGELGSQGSPLFTKITLK